MTLREEIKHIQVETYRCLTTGVVERCLRESEEKIIQAILARLPEKEGFNRADTLRIWASKDFKKGYNQAIDEVIKRIKE